jgi:hypothetical protein
MRCTMGVCMDFDTDTDGINDIKSMMNGLILIPPPNFFNKNIALTTLPSTWLEVIETKGKETKGTIKP